MSTSVTSSSELVPAPFSRDMYPTSDENQYLITGTTSSTMRRRRWKTASFFILSSQLLERFVFYTIVGNLVYFLTGSPYCWSSVNAVLAVAIYLTSFYVTPLFTGVLAGYINMFRTIVIGYVLYLLYILFPLMYFPTTNDGEIVFLFSNQCLPCKGNFTPTTRSLGQECAAAPALGALVAVGIGAGFIRSVISPFGADQVGENRPGRVSAFFHWYYWFINVGAFFSFSIFALFQQWWMFWSYMAAFIALALSFLLFLMGSRIYYVRPAELVNTPLKEIRMVMTFALRNKLQACCPCSRGYRSSNILAGVQQNGPAAPNDLAGSITNPDNTDIMETLVSEESMEVAFLDCAKMRFGGSLDETQVERVKKFLKIILLFITLLSYWTIFLQMQSTFYIQGLHMNLKFMGYKYFTVPPAWLSMFDLAAVVAFIPLLDNVILKMIKRLGYNHTPKGRIFAGLFFSLLSMFAAGLVEHYRIEILFGGKDNIIPKNITNQTIGNNNHYYFASPMTIAWQIPQYALMGFSEALVTVASLEYVFLNSPEKYLPLLNGFFWFSCAIGGAIGALIIELCDGHVFKEHAKYGSINMRVDFLGVKEGTLAIYFFGLGLMQFVGMIVFILIYRCRRETGQPYLEQQQRLAEDGDHQTPGGYNPNSREPPFIG